MLNCGTTESVSWLPATLVKTTFVPFPVVLGSEIRLPISMPACPRCTRTIGRHAPTLTGLLLFTVLVFLAALFPSWPIAGLLAETGPKRFDLTVWVAIGLTLTWPLLWYGIIRRPRNGQTSAFQPIRLVGIRRRWRSGNIQQVVLKFTNGAYRASFVEHNPELLAASVVRVK